MRVEGGRVVNSRNLWHHLSCSVGRTGTQTPLRIAMRLGATIASQGVQTDGGEKKRERSYRERDRETRKIDKKKRDTIHRDTDNMEREKDKHRTIERNIEGRVERARYSQR